MTQAQPDDWHRLWTSNHAALPEAVTVRATALADLGSELESADWLMVPTKYHQIYYQASADRSTVVEVYQVIDNLYDFLSRRTPAQARLPVRVFLVPGERGRSRCSRQAVAMRTGADADAAFIVSSLMHEETHLFNFAFLGESPQSWWAGEFSCIYHQERARLTQQGADLKSELSRRLPNGPVGPLASLEGPAQPAFDSAVSAQYFLEETYGTARMIEFRRQCLISSRAANGRGLPASVFRQVFGKDAAALDREWRTFYGWGGTETSLRRDMNLARPSIIDGRSAVRAPTAAAIVLFSAAGSKTIRAWGILNGQAAGLAAGVPYPGTFVIDRGGTILSRAFEQSYMDRDTAASILAKLRFARAPGKGATDAKVCFAPDTIPVQWTIALTAIER